MMHTLSSQSPASQSHGCILLFGMPRSGTTWLGKLFDSHPDTLYRHEPDSWRRLPMTRYPGINEAESCAESIRTFVEELPQVNALRVAGKLPLFPKAYLSPPRLHCTRAGIWAARVGSQLSVELPVFAYRAGSHYAERRVVWKSIESLGRLGVVLHVLPAARAVHILRHPCGYVASVLRGKRGKSFSYNAPAGNDAEIFTVARNTPLGQPYELAMDVCHTFTPEERLAWGWVLINEKALLECEATGRSLCIRYEDVCLDPINQTQEMFGFVGLEMTEQTRRFIAASTTRSDDRYYSVFKNPESAAMRWRDELSPDAIARIMAIVQRSRLAGYYAADSIHAPVKKQ